MARQIRLTEERRELLTHIARQRRRIDRRASNLVDQSLLLGSWRTYVERHPGRSLLGAAGVGMAISLLLTGGSREASQLGRKLYDAATGAAWGEVWTDLQQLFDLLLDEFSDVSAGLGREDDDA